MSTNKILGLENPFERTVLMSHRARELFYGAEKKVAINTKSPMLIAIKEISEGHISIEELSIRTSAEIRAKRSNGDTNAIDVLKAVEQDDKANSLQELKLNESINKNDIFSAHNIEIED